VELQCSTARFDWFDISFNLNENEHYSYTMLKMYADGRFPHILPLS
jgi:hypothetical protein